MQTKKLLGLLHKLQIRNDPRAASFTCATVVQETSGKGGGKKIAFKMLESGTSCLHLEDVTIDKQKAVYLIVVCFTVNMTALLKVISLHLEGMGK